MKQVVLALKIIFSKGYYRTIALGSSLTVGLISYWLFTQVTSVSTFTDMVINKEFGEYSLLYGVVYLITTIFIIVLSGVSISLIIWLYQHSTLSKGNIVGGVNAGAFVAGMIGMGCPVCGTFLLSAIGVTSGLSIFPLQGIELKLLSLGILTTSTIYGASKVSHVSCEECEHFTPSSKDDRKHNATQFPLEKALIFLLAGLFLINQLLITKVSTSFGLSSSRSFVGTLFGIKTKATYTIIAPKLNPDGKTTSLTEQPTITEVSGNPNSGDTLADAKVVMMASGKPFYAPEDVSFDDPINAQKKWGAYEQSIQLSGADDTLYQKLISIMTCSYCCGSSSRVTLNKQCGCAHAKAVRGFYKYMIKTYGSKYSDEQLIGESHRWYALWYPKGMLEDYMLATGKSEALPHKSHGGAGADGRHGLP